MDVQCWVDGRPRDHIMDWLLTVDDTDVGNRRGSTRELDSPLKPTGRCGFTSSAPITSDTPGKRLYQHHRRRPGDDADLLDQDDDHHRQIDEANRTPGRHTQLIHDDEEVLPGRATQLSEDESKSTSWFKDFKPPDTCRETHRGHSSREKPYERQKRRKTRHDRYIFKDHSKEKKKHQKKRQEKSRQNEPQSCRQPAPSRRRPTIQDAFHAQNVNQSRLTLKAGFEKAGFFCKGRASSPVKRHDLPDLSFSEMRFLSKQPKQNDEPELKNKGGSSRRSRSQDRSSQKDISNYYEKKAKTPCDDRSRKKKTKSSTRKSTPPASAKNPDDKFRERFSVPHHRGVEHSGADDVDVITHEGPHTIDTRSKSKCASSKAITLSPSPAASRSLASLPRSGLGGLNTRTSSKGFTPRFTPSCATETVSRPTSSEFELKAQAKLFENSKVGDSPVCDNNRAPTLEELRLLAEKPFSQGNPSRNARLLESNDHDLHDTSVHPDKEVYPLRNSPCSDQLPMHLDLNEARPNGDIRTRLYEPQPPNIISLMEANGYGDHYPDDAALLSTFHPDISSATVSGNLCQESGFVSDQQENAAHTLDLDELLTLELMERDLSPGAFNINSSMVDPIEIPSSINGMGWGEEIAPRQFPWGRSPLHEEVRFGGNRTGILDQNIDKLALTTTSEEETRPVAFCRPNKLY